MFLCYIIFNQENAMKNFGKTMFVVIIALTLFMAAAPVSASANFIRPVSPGVAPGNWEWTTGVDGSEIPMDLVTTNPPAWRLLLTNGLNVAGGAKICHPFRGGQFGWTGEIYMLNGDSWEKLTTNVDWVPTTEGRLMACAQASAAGIYALFGFYVQTEVICVKPPVSPQFIFGRTVNYCIFD